MISSENRNSHCIGLYKFSIKHAHQIVRLLSSNVNNIQIINHCDFFCLPEISQFKKSARSEGSSELKEKSETFRSFQEISFKHSNV